MNVRRHFFYHNLTDGINNYDEGLQMRVRCDTGFQLYPYPLFPAIYYLPYSILF